MPVSATNRMVEDQRSTARVQRTGQRETFRDNPYTGVPWGQDGWPDNNADTNDLTAEVFGTYPAPFATLAALKADATYGDGNLDPGDDFSADEFVRLGDNSLAHYNTDEWVAGAA